MLSLPPDFTQTILNTFKEDGKRWLAALPALLDEASFRWDLTDILPVPNLSYNFVAFAKRLPSPVGKGIEGEVNVILKLGVPRRELTGEITALHRYDGRGAVQLLNADAEKGMLLLERLQPGHMLTTQEDDDRATEISVEVMKALWNCSSDFSRSRTNELITRDYIKLKDWFNGLQRLRQRFHGATGPLPERLVAKAESLSEELFTENKDEMLLHGDFHHFNLLKSARGWLAIDPKGVIGPRGYEVGPLLINPKPGFLLGSDPRGQTERRIDILSERLDMEREYIRAWGLCHAVLSAWWGIEDNDPDQGTYSLGCADLFAEIHT